MLRKMRWRMMMLRMMRCRKSARAQKLGPYFVRACLAERQFNNSQEALSTQNYRQNAAATNLEPHFVRACAVELQLKFSQEPLCTEIYRKKARAQSQHLNQALAFTATVRTPQCGHIVWGITLCLPRLIMHLTVSLLHLGRKHVFINHRISTRAQVTGITFRIAAAGRVLQPNFTFTIIKLTHRSRAGGRCCMGIGGNR